MKLIDLHADTLLRLYEKRDRSLDRNDRHIDLQKLRVADSYAQCLALFNKKEVIGNSTPAMMEFVDYALALLQEHRDSAALTTSVEQLEANRRAGRLSIILTIEDLGPANGRLDVIRDLHRLGVRMMGLTWNYENSLGFPQSGDPAQMALGLKPFGIAAVELMNELGIVIDVSHLSDGGFSDVVRVSRLPFAASHSNARAVTNHPRNLTDDMIRTLSGRGGVMGINFCANFLSDDHRSTVENMIRHIRHIRQVGGMEVIAIGSDFDGIGGELEIGSVSQIGLLQQGLEKAGFTEREIEQIFYRNALRLFQQTG